ncbi:hypothetical protein WD019_08540 [Fictibacillus sp. Mic-4]|uniref:hypothetical protein n=1 Tax=Fictibacillus sp. Mic-4 TaxID=3132826 RepID=UPI003CE99EE4
MRLTSFLLFSLFIGAVFFLPTEAFANGNGLHGKNIPEKIADQRVRGLEKKLKPVTKKTPGPSGQQLKQKIEKETQKIEKKAIRRNANIVKRKVSKHAYNMQNSTRPKESKIKIKPKQEEDFPLHNVRKKGKSHLVKKRDHLTKAKRAVSTHKKQKKWKRKIQPVQKKVDKKAAVYPLTERTVTVSKKDVSLADTKKDESGHKVKKNGPKRKSVPERDTKQSDKAVIPSSSQAPSSGEGGNTGGHGSFSFHLKAFIFNHNALEENKLIHPFVARTKQLRNQWVNAPPTKPPKALLTFSL